MTVWPFLLAGCAVTAIWNWKAAIMFALAIGVGQATTRLELSQVHLLAGYTLLAVVATFFLDRYSGFTFAAFGLVIGLHLAGIIGHLPKVIAGEVLLIAGMLFSGYNGPSGGIFDRRADAPDHRHDTSVGAATRSAQEDSALSK